MAAGSLSKISLVTSMIVLQLSPPGIRVIVRKDVLRTCKSQAIANCLFSWTKTYSIPIPNKAAVKLYAIHGQIFRRHAFPCQASQTESRQTHLNLPPGTMTGFGTKICEYFSGFLSTSSEILRPRSFQSSFSFLPQCSSSGSTTLSRNSGLEGGNRRRLV